MRQKRQEKGLYYLSNLEQNNAMLVETIYSFKSEEKRDENEQYIDIQHSILSSRKLRERKDVEYVVPS